MPDQTTLKSILFVCTANMCRSPMAEALMKDLVTRTDEIEQWWIESAGVAALDGQPATGHTQTVAAERGMDLSRHQSRLTTRDIVEPFSMLLVMEQRHKDALQQAYPDLADRVMLLTEIAGKDGDIWDPIGSEIGNYRAMADQIQGILESGMGRIRSFSESHPTRP
jgi:protein-tyrosine-phosphatase